MAYFLLSGGKDEADGGGGAAPEVSTETPEFAFEIRKVESIPTVPGAKPDKAGAQPVAEAATEAMNAYYRAAFLDPNNWREDDYASAWSAFDKAALADAKDQADVITLGGDYTDAESVMPKPSTNSVKILLGSNGKPDTVVVQVTFGALVTDPSGEQTTVSNLGQYFLRPEGGKDWKIYAFRIDRKDEPGDQVVGSPSPEPKKKDKPDDGQGASPAAEETP